MRRAPGGRLLLATSVAGLVIALLSWHAAALVPEGGLDGSWAAGLSMAAHAGLSFGNQIVFTYGPLGFLTRTDLYYSDSGVEAFVYLLLVSVAFAAALFVAARRSYGLVVGFVVALVMASGSEQAVANHMIEAIAFLIAAVCLLDRPAERPLLPRHRLALAALAGAFAGVQLLLKESVGIEISAMAAVLALTLDGRRLENVAATAGGWVVGLLAGWLGSGQPLGQLPHFAHNALRIVSGYSGAMGVEYNDLGWQYAAGWFVFLAGVGAALHATARRTRRVRVGVLGLWLAFSFLTYKEGFVRHDLGHGAIFFAAMAAGFLAFRWRRGARWLGLGLAAALFAFSLAAQQHSFSDVFDPSASASSAVDQVRQVFSASERRATIAQGRAALERAYPIDPGTLALLRGHTVHVAPVDAAVAWAYGLRWKPLPVFQSYSTYTTGLDALNAATVSSAHAPERILENAAGDIDGRYQPFDQGLTTRAILCRYAELSSTGAWEVLGAGPQRCSAPVASGRISARWGTPVQIPPAPNDHSFVFVRISGVAPGGLELIRSLIYKPRQRTVQLDRSTFRLIAGTAEDGLVLRAPAGVDFTAPFNVAPNANTISVGREGGVPSGRVTYAFYTQSVDVGPRSAGLVPGVAVAPGALPAPPAVNASDPATAVDGAQAVLSAYCAHPQSSPPAAVRSTVAALVRLLGRAAGTRIAGGHFAGQTVRQVVGDFAGLLNSGCAPALGSRLGRSLRGR